MDEDIKRIPLQLNPDYKKVIPRFFNPGDNRSKKMIIKILEMPEAQVGIVLQNVLTEFSSRHKKISEIFVKHFELIEYLLPVDSNSLMTRDRMLLLGSYFTM